MHVRPPSYQLCPQPLIMTHSHATIEDFGPYPNLCPWVILVSLQFEEKISEAGVAGSGCNDGGGEGQGPGRTTLFHSLRREVGMPASKHRCGVCWVCLAYRARPL